MKNGWEKLQFLIVCEFLDYKKQMFSVYVSNKGNNSIETLTTMIIEALINELPANSYR